MKSSVLALTKAVLIPILTEWVDVDDLTYFDSAICNTNERDSFLELCKCDSFTQIGVTLAMRASYFDWLNVREIKVRRLNLTQNEQSLSKVLISILQRHQTIKHLEMHHCAVLNTIIDKYNLCIEELNLQGSSELLDEEVISLLSRIKGLTKLDISMCENITDESSKAIQESPLLHSIVFRNCPNISGDFVTENARNMKELIIGDDLTDSALLEVVEHSAATLTTLHIGHSAELSDLTLLKVAENCIHLTSFAITDSDVSDNTISQLVQSCPDLTHITLDNCHYLTDVAFLAIATYCSKLVHLEVAANLSMTDAALTQIAAGCKRLQALNVSGCDKITDASIVKIAQHCTQLIEMDVSECYQVTDYSIQTLYKHCPLLVGVVTFATAVTDISALHLVEGATSVRLNGAASSAADGDFGSGSDSDESEEHSMGSHSDASGNSYGESDEDGDDDEEESDDEENPPPRNNLYEVLFGANGNTVPTNDSEDEEDEDYQLDGTGVADTTLDQIRLSEVYGTDQSDSEFHSLSLLKSTPRRPLQVFTHRHTQLNSVTLNTLSVIAPAVEVFKIMNYKHISDETMIGILDNWKHTLLSVAIHHCTRLTGNTFLHLAKQCTRLTSLELVNCGRLNDDVLVKILALTSQTLLHLSLEKCINITDFSVLKIAQCKVLQRLNVSRCLQVSDTAITTVLTSCSDLTSIDLSGCALLTTKTFHTLTQLNRLIYVDVRCIPLRTAQDGKMLEKLRKNEKLTLKC